MSGTLPEENQQPPAPLPQTPSEKPQPVIRPPRFAQAQLTLGIIAITCIFYLLQVISTYWLGYDLLELYLAKINEMILQGQLWRLVTPVLLHGSILHVGMNMYALFIIGPGVERNYGRIRYLELYLIAGIFGNIFSFLFTSEPSLGASTAIFGLIAAQAVYIYRNRQFFGRAARPMLMNILIIIMINIFIGFLPGIDYWGHLGGLTGGLLFAWLAGPTYSVTETLLGPQLSEKKGISSTTIFILELILAASLVLIGFIFR